jgi:uncharacterized membrane protein YraQ (UPF0718 family)
MEKVCLDRASASCYRAFIGGFIAFLALTLLTLLDVRRGFLFRVYPVRTLFHVFTPAHGPMLASGLVGMIACYVGATIIEPRLPDTSRYVKRLTFVIFALLVIDLFAYRGVPAARSIAAGRVNADWLQAFGVIGWKRPIAQATSYLLNVWHATLLGILISGLTLSILPTYLKPYCTRAGFTGSLFGAMFALPQPFCSCCSSVMAPSLARRGASTNFLLSFVIGAPMLNVTTVVLALSLLPAPFAITRIVAGLFVTVVVTYLVARIADGWDHPQVAMAGTGPVTSNEDARTGRSSSLGGLRRSFVTWLQRIGGAYLSVFDRDRIAGGRPETLETPSQLFGAWLHASGRIALVLVPTLWVWSVVAAGIFQALPSAFGNNLPSVVLAAFGGTFFMISTWSEIPMALQLIRSGIDGPAAALLVVLPAISLPCMMLLGGSLGRFRLIALLSLGVIIVGIVSGAMFL